MEEAESAEDLRNEKIGVVFILPLSDVFFPYSSFKICIILYVHVVLSKLYKYSLTFDFLHYFKKNTLFDVL